MLHTTAQVSRYRDTCRVMTVEMPPCRTSDGFNTLHLALLNVRVRAPSCACNAPRKHKPACIVRVQGPQELGDLLRSPKKKNDLDRAYQRSPFARQYFNCVTSSSHPLPPLGVHSILSNALKYRGPVEVDDLPRSISGIDTPITSTNVLIQWWCFPAWPRSRVSSRSIHMFEDVPAARIGHVVMGPTM